MAVPWAVIDVDARGAGWPFEVPDRIAASGACWAVSTVRGWHVHFPHMTPGAAVALARRLRGDIGHARACAARGWSSERPVPDDPQRWIRAIHDGACWRLFRLLQEAHEATGRMVRVTGGVDYLASLC